MLQFALKVASPGITSLRVVYTDHAGRPSDTFHCPSQANVFRLPGQTPLIARAMQGSEIRDALAYRREHLIYQAGRSQELTTKLAIREAAHRLKLYNSAKIQWHKNGRSASKRALSALFVAAGPVSRILSAGLLPQDGHSSGPRITAWLKRPTRRL
jgi:hypothetical protein